MKVKITVLCENSVFGIGSWGATAEHGWAVFLETDQGNFLVDTGQGMSIVNNARILKKDLGTLQGIILSHHHSDHTGGLLSVLETSGPVKVYAHPDIFKDSYSIQIEGKEFAVGIPFKRSILESYGAQFVFVSQYREIAPGFFLTGEIPRHTPFEKGDPKLVIKGAKGYEPDLIQDDLTVVLDTAQGLVIILGCSHAGLVNIIDYVRDKTGKSNIYAIIGGTHLAFAQPEQLDATISKLKACAVQKIGVSHCTGMASALRMSQEFGDKFFFCPVGTVLEV
jgi:7,8-dihydropterin-6-yl-methyl-4-(beta-D-ribofuranosyl)aminobenzene 5'-phosphate synthase